MEWIRGFPRGTYTAGHFGVLLASYAAGIALAAELDAWPHSPLNSVDLLVLLGSIALFGAPASLAYFLLMPTQANLGIMPDGVIVEMTSPFRTFRQAYRWNDLKLRGHSLIIPQANGRPLRLSRAQLKSVAPWIPA